MSGVELELRDSVGRMRAYTRDELHRLFVVGSRIMSVVVVVWYNVVVVRRPRILRSYLHVAHHGCK